MAARFSAQGAATPATDSAEARCKKARREAFTEKERVMMASLFQHDEFGRGQHQRQRGAAAVPCGMAFNAPAISDWVVAPSWPAASTVLISASSAAAVSASGIKPL